MCFEKKLALTGGKNRQERSGISGKKKQKNTAQQLDVASKVNKELTSKRWNTRPKKMGQRKEAPVLKEAPLKGIEEKIPNNSEKGVTAPGSKKQKAEHGEEREKDGNVVGAGIKTRKSKEKALG